MTLQVIDIGQAADDGTGDPLRTAFDKANDNFAELFTFLGDGEDLSAASARASLELGTAALQNASAFVAAGSLATVASSGAYSDLTGKPTALSAFSNDTNFITSAGAPVQSVAGRTGAVALAQADVSGLTTGSSPTFAGATLSGLTSGRVVLTGSGGQLIADGISFNTTSDELTLGDAATGGVRIGGSGILSIANVFYTAANGNYLFSMHGAEAQLRVMQSAIISWNAGGTSYGTGPVASIGKGGANALVFGGTTAAAGDAATELTIRKAVTTFSDNVAKAVFTFTVPNGAHRARALVSLLGGLGAGGSVGAEESSQEALYVLNITRTASKNAVATLSAAFPQAAAASVAGAHNIAVTGELSSISGTTSATNTFTLNAKCVKSGGSSDNHNVLGWCQLLNANASGITVA
jgi:hypothetical protein